MATSAPAPQVIEDLSDEECYLLSILTDHSGLDLAEFAWYEPDLAVSDDGCWRAWPFQWKWFRDASPLQIDQCARSVGKTTSITLRMFAFPFLFPGQEAVITAPELVHLEPLTNLIERKFYDCRLGREMLPGGRSSVTHRPFMMNFVNGARIIGRIPQRDGKGVKGIHPIWLELDEAQDYPASGWTELIETLKRGHEGAVWRAHGVTRGMRDKFYEYTQDTPDNRWKVHRYCLPTGTMVYTTGGPVPIEEIRPGVEVHTITEDGQLASDQVTALIDNGIQPTWKVRTKGGYGLVTTANHPYLVLHRAGTRRTRRELGFEWVEAADVCPGDYIVCARELPSTGDRFPTPDEVTATLQAHSPQRTVPGWVWEAPRSLQLAFLHGYLMGDGSLSRQKVGQDPWQIGTASLRMAKELRALCHYLGLRTSTVGVNGHGTLGNGPQYRFYVYPDEGPFRQVPLMCSSVKDGQMLEGLGKNFVARRVDVSEATGMTAQTWDITVGDQHNFIAEGVVVHNTAMARPNWTDEERQEKIQQYKTRDNPDYRRNVLGLHGDATNPLFVLHRLMKVVDADESSEYNTDIYRHTRIATEMLTDRGANHDIEEFLEYNPAHDGYVAYWAGMDVGITKDPTEILVFGEEKNRLRLLQRVHLERIQAPLQAQVIEWLFRAYPKMKRFAMDKTGLGLPIFQDLQHDRPTIAERITGYNFSEKILVDFDDAVVAGLKEGEDDVKEAGIQRQVLEYATDKLRDLVDREKIQLPWDAELIGEFQGQTWSFSKSSMDIYGRPRRVFSEGTFHALDAARMAAMGYSQFKLDEMMKNRRKADERPVFDYFMDDGGGFLGGM